MLEVTTYLLVTKNDNHKIQELSSIMRFIIINESQNTTLLFYAQNLSSDKFYDSHSNSTSLCNNLIYSYFPYKPKVC